MQTATALRVIEWLADIGKNRVWLANECKCSPATITRILNEGLEPSLDAAVTIESLSEGRVKCRDWVGQASSETALMVGS